MYGIFVNDGKELNAKAEEIKCFEILCIESKAGVWWQSLSCLRPMGGSVSEPPTL